MLELFNEFYDYLLKMDLASFAGFWEWLNNAPTSVAVFIVVGILGLLVGLWAIIHATFTPFD